MRRVIVFRCYVTPCLFERMIGLSIEGGRRIARNCSRRGYHEGVLGKDSVRRMGC